MDAVDRFFAAVTGSQVRFSAATRDVGVESLIELQLRSGLGRLDPSAPQILLQKWAVFGQLSTTLPFYSLARHSRRGRGRRAAVLFGATSCPR